MPDARFLGACEQLARWCEESRSAPIDIGVDGPRRFSCTRRHENAELDAFERRFAISLPEDYRAFMRIVGTGQLFVNEFGLGFEFPSLDELPEYAREVFHGAGDDRFPELVLICGLNGRGDLGGLYARESGVPFSVFFHECPTDDWGNDGEVRIPFGDWIVQLVDSKGETDLP